jgi:hypothetical protein
MEENNAKGQREANMLFECEFALCSATIRPSQELLPLPLAAITAAVAAAAAAAACVC